MMRANKKIFIIFILIILLFPALSNAKRWRLPKEWTFQANYSRVFKAAKRLPNSLPLERILTAQGQKKMVFISDWGTMDIEREVTLLFFPIDGNTRVKVEGAPAGQAYKILKTLGDKLDIPVKAPKRRFRN